MKGGLRTRYRTALRRGKQHQDSAAIIGVHKSAGFTIVEVMIVLAVTSLLFISAAAAISGRTGKTQFQQSINDIVTALRQNINSTAIGYYPNASNFKCTNSSGTMTVAGGANTQGTNNDCIFLGKAIQFGVTGTDPQQYVTYPIAALRVDTNGDEVHDIATAKPAVIYPSPQQTNAPNDTQVDKLMYGLTVSKMIYNNNVGNTIGAFAVISDLSNYSYSNSQLQSGSQQLILVPISTTNLNDTVANAASKINQKLPTSPTATLGIQICFDSGTTDQSGLVTIGGSGGQQLNVSLQIKSGKGCGL
jgi:prepilin-type N-terminal cleavage/methylation domain-containing protein